MIGRSSNTHLSNHLSDLTSSSYPVDCVYGCVGLRVCMLVQVCFDCFVSLLCNGLSAPIFKKTAFTRVH